jgi:hypothetical protein
MLASSFNFNQIVNTMDWSWVIFFIKKKKFKNEKNNFFKNSLEKIIYWKKE